jgi:DNA-binding IclR family transcriptional regulator
MSNHQRGIQTVELAGDILKLVCRSKRSLSLSEIAEQLELAPGSAYKYLISLLRTGLLKRNETTLEYEAGPLSLRMGLSKMNHHSMLIQARAELTRLAEQYHVNAFASMWSSSNGPTVVFYKEYGGFFNIGFRLGMRLSMVNTTTGRLFAAYMDESRLTENDAILEADEILKLKHPEFIAEINQIKAQGYSTLTDIPTPGFRSYAVPVFDSNQQFVMTLTVFGPSDQFSTDQVNTIVHELNQLAKQMEGHIHG